jgi:cardiolipin synthase
VLGIAWLQVGLIGNAMLWVAALLTLLTGWDYLNAGLRHVSPPPRPDLSPQTRRVPPALVPNPPP